MFSLFLCNISDHVFCFLESIHKLAEVKFLSLWILCPETFLLTCCIVGDHLVRRIQDVLGGTVVLLQADHLRIRENPLESKDVANVGSAEFVDGLVIITYYA